MHMKRCIGCGHLNPAEAMTCGADGCGADLRYAEEVFVSENEAPTNLTTASSSQATENPDAHPSHEVFRETVEAEVCHCPFARAKAGEICAACGGRVPDDTTPGARAGSDPARPSQRALAESEVRAGNLRIRLPNQHVVIPDADVLLGRGRDVPNRTIADALAGFPGVSRHHAMLLFGDGQARLLDLGSKNGTWINDQRLTAYVPYPLAIDEGVRVRLGLSATLLIERAS